MMQVFARMCSRLGREELASRERRLRSRERCETLFSRIDQTRLQYHRLIDLAGARPL